MNKPKVPPANSAVYRAAAIIFADGPQPMADLFRAIDFGKLCFRFEKMENAIRNGWLADVDGKIGISEFARVHFGGKPEAPTVKYSGQVATTREPYAFDAPPLSKRHIPNPQGFRDDVPKYSVRSGVRCYSVAGGKV